MDGWMYACMHEGMRRKEWTDSGGGLNPWRNCLRYRGGVCGCYL